jgi:hypothetical protein
MSIIVQFIEKVERRESAKADGDGFGLKSRLRRYTNLGRIKCRLQRLLTHFRRDRRDALLGLRGA